MNPFREMVLIPIDDYRDYKSKENTSSQQEPAASDIEREIRAIRDRYGSNIPDDQRQRLEAQVIDKYVERSASLTKPEPISTTTQTPVRDDMHIRTQLNAFTQANRGRAIQLYEHLSAHDIKIDNLGQLVNEDDTPIIGSSIIDLIDYVTNTLKRRDVPRGFNAFKQILTRINMPSKYLSAQGKSRVRNVQEPFREDMQDIEYEDINNQGTPASLYHTPIMGWQTLRNK